MKRTNLATSTIIELFMQLQTVKALTEIQSALESLTQKDKGGNGSPGKENIPPTPPIREKETLPYPQKETREILRAREEMAFLSSYLFHQIELIKTEDTAKKVLDDPPRKASSIVFDENGNTIYPTVADIENFVRINHEMLDMDNIVTFDVKEFFEYWDNRNWEIKEGIVAKNWHSLVKRRFRLLKIDYRKEKLAEAAKPKPDVKKLTPSQLRRLDSRGRGMATNYL